MMPLARTAILLVFCITLALAETASTSTGKAIMILDASGSMWGEVEGQTKIDIAKKASVDILKDWSSNIELGLIAYGHRRKGDCGDIEALVPVGPFSFSPFRTTIQALSPKGKTPLDRTIRRAAEELTHTESKATVILISDGIETCGGDPCAAARELEARGIDFTVHVVGFDVEKGHHSQLRCIAEATGGKFFAPQSAADLQEALRSVKQEVVAPAVKKQETELGFYAVLQAGQEPLKEPAFWTVFQEDKLGELKSIAESSHTWKPSLVLSPGRYMLRIKYDNTLFRKEITVGPDESGRKEIILDAGQYSFYAVLAPEQEPFKEPAFWTVSQEDALGEIKDIAESLRTWQPSFILPAGELTLRAKYDDVRFTHKITVRAGETARKEIPLNAGHYSFHAVLAAGQKPFQEPAFWTVWKSDELGEKEKIADSIRTWKASFVLPAGEAILRVRYDNTPFEHPLVVQAGEVETKEIPLNASHLSFYALDASGGQPSKQSAFWAVFRENELGDKIRFAESGLTSMPSFVLPAGEFTLRAKYDGNDFEEKISVQAGETGKRSVSFSGEQ